MGHNNPLNLLPFFNTSTISSSSLQQQQQQSVEKLSPILSIQEPQSKSIFSSYSLVTPQFLHPIAGLALSVVVYPLTRIFRRILSVQPLPVQVARPTSRPLRQAVEAGCAVPLFRPYVAQVPWHGGTRAFFSQLFPRYGHYCGPNWSSGKDGGSMLWDRRPIDWLDFCCYCHDIGYDTHDQAKLLRADVAFPKCLERPKMATKGGAYAALVYRAMCVAGLRSILIPYRTLLVKLQNGPSIPEVVNDMIGKVRNSGRIDTRNRKEML